MSGRGIVVLFLLFVSIAHPALVEADAPPQPPMVVEVTVGPTAISVNWVPNGTVFTSFRVYGLGESMTPTLLHTIAWPLLHTDEAFGYRYYGVSAVLGSQESEIVWSHSPDDGNGTPCATVTWGPPPGAALGNCNLVPMEKLPSYAVQK